MNELTVTNYKGVRVLTTQQIAEAYETNTDTITKNFNRNKDRYAEGKHYICLEGTSLKEFKTNGQIDLPLKLNKLYLWTKKGAFLHAKSLNTDTAWEVYDRLVDNYFDRQDMLEGLSPEVKAIFAVDKRVTVIENKVDSVRQDLEDFKMDLPILGIEIDQITEAVRKRGVSALGGKETNAYGAGGEEYQTVFITDLQTQIDTIKQNVKQEVADVINDYDFSGKFSDYTYDKGYLDSQFKNQLKVLSVEALPAAPDLNTIYLIQGEVTVD